MTDAWPIVVDPVFGCHLWDGPLNDHGRPVVWRGSKPQSAIRIAIGDIAADKVPDHLCRRIRCVNAAHLEAVTKGENERRKAMRYRLARKMCSNGHVLNETTRLVTPEMGVLCRRCKKESA